MKKKLWTLLFLCMVVTAFLLPAQVFAETNKGTWVFSHVQRTRYPDNSVSLAADVKQGTVSIKSDERVQYSADLGCTFEFGTMPATIPVGNESVKIVVKRKDDASGGASHAAIPKGEESNQAKANQVLAGMKIQAREKAVKCRMMVLTNMSEYVTGGDDMVWEETSKFVPNNTAVQLSKQDLYYEDMSVLGSSAKKIPAGSGLKYDNKSYLVVSIGINEGLIRSQAVNTYVYSYVYKYNPKGTAAAATTQKGTSKKVKQEVNTAADNSTEESGTDLEGGIVDAKTAAAAAIAVVLGGAAAGGAAGTTTNGGGDDPDGGDEPKKKTYRMYFRKNFGDTIRYDAAAQTVYARMVEISEDGHEVSRNDLTAQIQFSSKDGSLGVVPVGMSGDYAAAQVSASSAGGADHDVGVLSVSFTGAGGTFQNNIHFRLLKGEIIFPKEQVELNLAAGNLEPNKLMFAVVGADEKTVIDAKIEPEGCYDVKIEPQGEDPNVFYAVITERADTKQKAKPAGEIDIFNLYVKAKLDPDDAAELSGSMMINRFHMGLRVVLDRYYIGAYLEVKEGYEHIPREKLHREDYILSETKFHMHILDWHKEKQYLMSIPVVPKTFEVVPDDENDSATKKHLELLKIGRAMDDKPAMDGRFNCMYGRIACTAGGLDAPIRHRVRLRMTAEYDGKTYTYEEKLWLNSQPMREFDGPGGVTAYEQADNEKIRHLERIKQVIDQNGYYDNLFPLYKLIDAMLDGYDIRFGIDEVQYQMCRNVFFSFMEGSFAGANATPEVVTLADEMLMFVTATVNKSAEIEKSMGFFERMVLGFFTLGCLDVAFTTMNVVKSMKDYAEQGGDSVIEAFRIGVEIVAIDFYMEKVTELGMGYVAVKAKDLGLTEKLKETGKKLVDFDRSRIYNGIKNKLGTVQTIKGRAKAGANEKVNKFLKKGLTDPDDLRMEKAFQNAKKLGKEKVNDLQAAYDLMKANPTEANTNMFRKQVARVQEDEFSMSVMKQLKGQEDMVAKFNMVNQGQYAGAKSRMLEELRNQGIDPSRVEFFEASANKGIFEGKSVPKDHDITIKVDGKPLPQKEAQALYEKAYYEQITGLRDGEKGWKYGVEQQERASSLSKKRDQSVVQLESMENYGSEKDLGRMVNADEQHLPFENASRVGQTVEHKSAAWLDDAKNIAEGEKVTKLKADIAAARQKGLTSNVDLLEAELEQTLAQIPGKQMEGMRQATKQWKYVVARDAKRYAENGRSMISLELRENMEILAKGASGELSPVAVERIFKDKGTSIEGVIHTMAQVVVDVG